MAIEVLRLSAAGGASLAPFALGLHQRRLLRVISLIGDGAVLDAVIASRITKSGTRNHARGMTGWPKRSLISISRRAAPNTRWMRFSSRVRLTWAEPSNFSMCRAYRSYPSSSRSSRSVGMVAPGIRRRRRVLAPANPARGCRGPRGPVFGPQQEQPRL